MVPTAMPMVTNTWGPLKITNHTGKGRTPGRMVANTSGRGRMVRKPVRAAKPGV